MNIQNIRNDIQFLTQREMALAALRLIASVGAQWIFGFMLYVNRDNEVAEKLFIITTSLQGFFVALSILTTQSMRIAMKRWMVKTLAAHMVTPVQISAGIQNPPTTPN